jgi:hypothetical protein
MKNSIHRHKHQAKKALRQAVMESENITSPEAAKQYSDQYYKNFYASRPSVHKTALDHYIKELKRHQKMGSGKKHAKRASPGQVSTEHPFTIRENNPNYNQKHTQTKINESSKMRVIKSRKSA